MKSKLQNLFVTSAIFLSLISCTIHNVHARSVGGTFSPLTIAEEKNTTGGGPISSPVGSTIATSGSVNSQAQSNTSSSRIVRTPLNNRLGVGSPIFDRTHPDLIIDLPTDPTNPLPPPPPPETAEPNPPFMSFWRSIDTITIKWYDNSKVEDGYRVELNMEEDLIFVGEFGPLDGDDGENRYQTYKFSDLIPDTEYCLRVVAYNEYGDSEDVDFCTSTYKLPPSRGCTELESVKSREPAPPVDKCPENGTTVTISEDYTLPEGCDCENVSFKFTESNIVFEGNGNTLRHKYKPKCTGRSCIDVFGKMIAFQVVNGEGGSGLSNIVIRNTDIEGYHRGIRIKLNISSATKERLQYGLMSFRDRETRASIMRYGMPNDLENDLRRMAPHCIYIENVDINHTSSVGLEVGAYAHNVTFDHGSACNAGAPGIYLSFGTRFNTISNSTITGNDREGLALDASAFNHIHGNYFKDNERNKWKRKYGMEHIRGGGGIFLYKNAWEYPDRKNSVPRYQHSEGNWIQNNEFVSEITGVWIGSRQSADRNHKSINPLGDDRTCGDPLMWEDEGEFYNLKKSYFRDYAEDTIVEGNTFTGGGRGVIVEDDGARIFDNRFVGSIDVGIKIGSRVRNIVGDPINDTEVRDNVFSSTVEDRVELSYPSIGTRFCNNMVEYPNGYQDALGLFPQRCDKRLSDDLIKTDQTAPDKLDPVSTAPEEKEDLFKVDHTGPEILTPVSTTPEEKDKDKWVKDGVKVPVFNLGKFDLL